MPPRCAKCAMPLPPVTALAALTNPSGVCSFHVANLDVLDRDHFTSDVPQFDTTPAFNELEAELPKAVCVQALAAQGPARRWV